MGKITFTSVITVLHFQQQLEALSKTAVLVFDLEIIKR